MKRTGKKIHALSAKPVTPERIDLSWQPVPGADHYVISRGKQSCAPQDEQAMAEVKDASWTDRDLLPGSAYRYTVTARTRSGENILSLQGNCRTPNDGLSVFREGSLMGVRGDTFEFTWDSDRGGEITGIRQYDGHSWFSVNHPDIPTVPGLVFENDEGDFFPAGGQKGVEFSIEKETRKELMFSFSLEAAGIETGFRYHVFSEGILFCEITMPAGGKPGGPTQGVDAEENMKKLDRLHGRLGLHLAPEILEGKFAWGCFRRQYPPSQSWKARNGRVVDKNRMMPIAMAEYGRNPEGGFTNRLEFFIEDSPYRGASTWFGDDGDGGFKFEWGFSGKSLRGLYYVCWDMGFLRTRWGICLGAARKGHFGRVPASQRNNLTGAKILHTGASQAILDSRREKWPYNVPPANLITGMDTGLPSDDQVREARAKGVDVIILHQSWMRSGGSNADPPGDYVPRDPDDLKRFADTCRLNGIRVGLYMRGVEKYALFQPYFERFMRRNIDGLYVDHNTPYSPGFQGCNELHYSAYNYFLFTRALRDRVGDRGFLIAHTGPFATSQAVAVFDAYLPGEFKTQKHNFFNSADHAIHYGFSSCAGTNPISNPEFSTRQAVAFFAGLGMHAHAGRGKDHMEGLWRIWDSIPMEKAVMHNGMTENFKPVRSSSPGVFTTVYRVHSGLILAVTANLGKTTDAGICLDLAGLGMSGEYRVTELSGRRRDEFSSRRVEMTAEGEINIGRMPRYEFRGYRIERPEKISEDSFHADRKNE